jgi:hypothetical protein
MQILFFKKLIVFNEFLQLIFVDANNKILNNYNKTLLIQTKKYYLYTKYH